MSTYKELQKQASELGITSVGVSKKDLENAIKDKLNGKVASVNSKPSVNDNPPQRKDSGEEEATPQTEEKNIAIVKKGNQEVRRYTLVLHGENFKDLAETFAGKNNYSVVMDTAKEGITCPSCKHVFYL
jgi:hypothetical protein